MVGMGKTLRSAGRTVATVIASVGILVSCVRGPNTPWPEGHPELCESACENLQRLGCEEGHPTPDGDTCQDWCESVETSGFVSINPACIAAIQKCEDIDTCSE
jgi:hypothetical protein